MNIGKILEVTGKSALKNIPLGGVIVDVAELMIGDRFDKKTVSGDDIKQAVETLSPTAKAEFLAKTLDVDARMLESTNMLKQKMEADTPVSSRYGYRYYVTGTIGRLRSYVRPCVHHRRASAIYRITIGSVRPTYSCVVGILWFRH